MKAKIREEKGTILVIAAGSMVVMMLFAAMAIDVGSLLTARNQLQAAVDASALAGAAGLLVDQTDAINMAITTAAANTCVEQPVVVTSGDISFPASNRIRVHGTHPVNLNFARVIGMNTVNVEAIAEAEIGRIIGTRGMRPWAIPDMEWPIGTPVMLKCGSLGAPSTNPGHFYPIDFPPLNKGTPIVGAQQYEENIAWGSQDFVEIGDQLQVEPGNQIGPTKHGINELIAQDPYAYYNDIDGVIQGSMFSGNSSPRIVKIPLFDPDYPPDSGRNYLDVIGLASFFVVGLQGNDVIGIFLEITTPGRFGEGNTTLRGTRLVL
jgi:hypothetical protein